MQHARCIVTSDVKPVCVFYAANLRKACLAVSGKAPVQVTRTCAYTHTQSRAGNINTCPRVTVHTFHQLHLNIGGFWYAHMIFLSREACPVKFSIRMAPVASFTMMCPHKEYKDASYE